MAQTLRSAVELLDYLAMDDASALRHEYVAGDVHAMTGGTMRHNRIALNIARLLMDRFDAATSCQVFINDMKLHVRAADSVYYPDVFVYCGGAIAGGEKVVADALLVVEVSSESTAGIDQREKRVAYQKLPGLRAYWIVSQNEPRVEVHLRDAAGRWQAAAYGAGDEIALDGLADVPVALARLYAGTDIG